jgi:precorrin-6Y C5,15-methyltransferase (decarboxylating)
VIAAHAPDVLASLEKPDAVFVGGGLDLVMFGAIWSLMRDETRIVAHAVTLETEALLGALHQQHGGDLLRIELSQAAPLGRYRSWEASRPVVQWSAVKGAGA